MRLMQPVSRFTVGSARFGHIRALEKAVTNPTSISVISCSDIEERVNRGVEQAMAEKRLDSQLFQQGRAV